MHLQLLTAACTGRVQAQRVRDCTSYTRVHLFRLLSLETELISRKRCAMNTLSEYEKNRLQNIAENKRILAELGFDKVLKVNFDALLFCCICFKL